MKNKLENESWEGQDREAFKQAYYCRVIKSFSICCRLCFFNPQNRKCLKDKVGYLKQILRLPPYSEAFSKVRIQNAEWRLKVVIILGRVGARYGIYLLHMADIWGKRIRKSMKRIQIHDVGKSYQR